MFPYRATVGRCLAPAIPLKLLHLDGHILPATRAIVDSGADVSMFPGQWGLYGVYNKDLKVVLLGREDFFQQYRVSFDQRQKTFRVEPY